MLRDKSWDIINLDIFTKDSKCMQIYQSHGSYGLDDRLVRNCHWICFWVNHLFEKGKSCEPKVHCWDKKSVNNLGFVFFCFCSFSKWLMTMVSFSPLSRVVARLGL